MARKTPRRDSKGRFLPSGSRSRSRGRSRSRSRGRGRRSFRGMGSMITVRPGIGALQGREMLMESVLPHLAGGGLSAITCLGLRYFVDPAKGKYQNTLVKWAPAFGGLAGVLGATALYYTEGKSAAVAALVSTGLVTAAGFGGDYLMKGEKAGQIHAALVSGAASDASAGTEGIYGVGAIVPEYNTPAYSVGIGAITATPGGDNPFGIGYGREVQLEGVNIDSFGTPAY